MLNCVFASLSSLFCIQVPGVGFSLPWELPENGRFENKQNIGEMQRMGLQEAK